jgi:hypothetical protein
MENRSAPGPALSTRPTTWWPGMMGNRGGGVRPSISSSSVWQTPQAATRIRISWSPGFGMGIVSRHQRGIRLFQIVDTRQYHGIHLVHGDGFWIGVKRICKKLKNDYITGRSDSPQPLHQKRRTASDRTAGRLKCFPKGGRFNRFRPVSDPAGSAGLFDRIN